MLDEQIEKDIALSCKMGLYFGSSRSMYLNVARIHAQKIEKDSDGVLRRKEQWKRINEPILTCESHSKCDKKPEFIVSHEMERFYGKKHMENVYCEKHAKEAVKRLKKPKPLTYGDGHKETPNYKPIEIRKL